MAGDEGRYEDGDEGKGERQNGEEVGVEADEGVDGEEGEGLRGSAPEEEANGFGLKFEDDADTGVEAREVGDHCGGGEGRTGGLVGGRGRVRPLRWLGRVFDGSGYYLLNEPGRMKRELVRMSYLTLGDGSACGSLFQ